MTLKNHKCKIIIITGDCGVGKSTIFPMLASKCKSHNIDVHEMDEIGVPQNPTFEWRRDTTFYWLTKAVKNFSKGISTIIVGMIDPQDVEESSQIKYFKHIHFIHLDVSKSERIRRLQERGETRKILMEHHGNLLGLRVWFKTSLFPFEYIDTTDLEIETYWQQVWLVISHLIEIKNNKK